MVDSRGRVRRRGKASAGELGRHFDNAGHLDPGRIAELLELTAEARARQAFSAFVGGSAVDDELAEQLGEGAVVAMTSGGELAVDQGDEELDEQWGGPFIVTSGSKEFASGTDDSNIAEATREPFPTTFPSS